MAAYTSTDKRLTSAPKFNDRELDFKVSGGGYQTRSRHNKKGLN